MPGGRARRLCPHAIVVSPRMSAYSEASKAVYRVVDDTTPVVEGLTRRFSTCAACGGSRGRR
jgi:DNA polymerase-4